MWNYLCFLLFILVYQPIFADVPVYNPTQNIMNTEATVSASAGLSQLLDNIKKIIQDLSATNSAAEQVVDLHNLINLENQVHNLCVGVTVCSKNQRDQINAYLTTLNKNIIDQFNNINNALNQANSFVSSLSEIVAILSGAPGNVAAATLALQKSVLKLEMQTQQTLAQIQQLFIIQSQKQQTEEQIEQINSNATYSGFAACGL